MGTYELRQRTRADRDDRWPTGPAMTARHEADRADTPLNPEMD